jgi:hypothetical protein
MSNRIKNISYLLGTKYTMAHFPPNPYIIPTLNPPANPNIESTPLTETEQHELTNFISTNIPTPDPTTSQVPPLAFSFWEGTQLTYLQFLTIYTLRKFNPNIRIRIYISTPSPSNPTHFLSTQSNPQLHPCGLNIRPDRSIRLHSLALIPRVELIELNLNQTYHFDVQIPSVHKADIVRIFKLHEHGGIWFDLDILFYKPIDSLYLSNHYDLTYFSYTNTIATGLILAPPKTNPLTLLCYITLERLRHQGLTFEYQEFGPTLWARTVLHNRSLFSNSKVLPNKIIYPYIWNQVNYIFFSKEDLTHPTETLGIHWYNGSPYSRLYINRFDINDLAPHTPDKNIFEQYAKRALDQYDLYQIQSICTTINPTTTLVNTQINHYDYSA